MAQRYSVTRQIQAPIELVFSRISDIERFAEVNEHIVEIEFLTEQRSGVGTRFKETREMNGRRSTTTLELTEYVENDRVRLVADQGGAIWDTVMSVTEKDGATELRMVMDARPYKLMARIVTPLIKGMVTRAVVADMDGLKTNCEKGADARGGEPAPSVGRS